MNYYVKFRNIIFIKKHNKKRIIDKRNIWYKKSQKKYYL